MMRFHYTISHVRGKDLTIADTLSRAPAMEPTQTDGLFQEEMRAYSKAILKAVPSSEQCLQEI